MVKLGIKKSNVLQFGMDWVEYREYIRCMRMDTYQESATDVYGYTMWTVKLFPIFMFGHADVRCAVMMWRGHDQSSLYAHGHVGHMRAVDISYMCPGSMFTLRGIQG